MIITQNVLTSMLTLQYQVRFNIPALVKYIFLKTRLLSSVLEKGVGRYCRRDTQRGMNVGFWLDIEYDVLR